MKYFLAKYIFLYVVFILLGRERIEPGEGGKGWLQPPHPPADRHALRIRIRQERQGGRRRHQRLSRQIQVSSFYKKR